MYRGFRVDISLSDTNLNTRQHLELGKIVHNTYNDDVRRELRRYIRSGNYLDGNGIQRAWFPEVKADVFISHSHTDKDLAFALAGWLYRNFEIDAFIDSAVWGYADDLLKEMDERYCRNANGINYNYEKRNLSTSHVHLMVASAITSMIDRCECLFFLNTPSSLQFADGNTITESPWLYYEIGQSQNIRKKLPDRELYESQRLYSDGGVLEKALRVRYKVDLTHLSELDDELLTLWYAQHSLDEDDHALDQLYDLIPPKKVSNQING